ncbi:MAG: hypothetical protein ACREF7_03580 [Candidatus Saccharimonadales bacterium]
MTRRQFLITLGLGVIGLFGLSSLLGMLSQNESKTNNGPAPYGIGNYGP